LPKQNIVETEILGSVFFEAKCMFFVGTPVSLSVQMLPNTPMLQRPTLQAA